MINTKYISREEAMEYLIEENFGYPYALLFFAKTRSNNPSNEEIMISLNKESKYNKLTLSQIDNAINKLKELKYLI